MIRAAVPTNEAERQYALALEKAGVGSWDWSAETGLIDWSPTREMLFGLTPGSFDGSCETWLRAVHAEDRNTVEETLHRRPTKFAMRYRIVRPNAEVRWICDRGGCTYNEQGQVLGAIGFSWDVTDEGISKRTIPGLPSAKAVDQAQNLFLANISHEMRTPLHGVLGMADLLLDGPLTEEQREYAEIIRESGETLLLVVNDILDLTTIEAGRFNIQPAPFNLHRTVAHTIATVQAQADEKGLVLNTDFRASDPVEFIGDGIRLRQVLLNYLTNAIKFTEHGEIRVEIRMEGRTEQTANVLIAVHDTGDGISEEAQASLFHPFTQLDISGTRARGAGLGLALSSRIAELMGGTVGVISTPGEGSTFWLHVPLEISKPFPD